MVIATRCVFLVIHSMMVFAHTSNFLSRSRFKLPFNYFYWRSLFVIILYWNSIWWNLGWWEALLDFRIKYALKVVCRFFRWNWWYMRNMINSKLLLLKLIEFSLLCFILFHYLVYVFISKCHHTQTFQVFFASEILAILLKENSGS